MWKCFCFRFQKNSTSILNFIYWRISAHVTRVSLKGLLGQEFFIFFTIRLKRFLSLYKKYCVSWLFVYSSFVRKFFNTSKRPVGVFVVTVCVFFEVVALFLLTCVSFFAFFRQNVNSVGGAIFLLVMLITLTVTIFCALYSFFCLQKYWTKNLLFTWQIFQISLAIPTILGGQTLPGTFLILLAITTMIFLVNSQVTLWVGKEKKI